MFFIRFTFVLLLFCFAMACNKSTPPPNSVVNAASSPTPAVEIATADHFAYPVGKTETVTAAKDKDGWFNEVKFGQDDNLGDNWTFDAGGNSACGEPVYAIANGLVTYADFSGPEWGLVVIIDHKLPSGEKVQSLYGHLMDASVKKGDAVKKRDQIGTLGNANGRYLCKLHFEIRKSECPSWGEPGPLSSKVRTGWVDPSTFIDTYR